MNRDQHWLLPDGVEEVLPGRAAAIEQLRRRLLDLFGCWGYELVFPPLIEFLDSLLNGAGRDLERQTFKITDQQSGRLMGIRADITPQVARMDAHSLRRQGPSRLSYCSTAVRARSLPGGSRTPYQIGVELFGHAGTESDIEVISLLLEALTLSGVRHITLDIGHVGLYRALVRHAGLSEADELTLSDIYLRKARDELDAFLAERALTAELRDALAALPWLMGDMAVLDQIAATLGDFHEQVARPLDELRTVAAFIARRYPQVQLHVDVGELRGYHYHTGILFAAYGDQGSEPLAKGGRYDAIGAVYGRARAATGFSADLKLLARSVEDLPLQPILAVGDWADDAFASAVRRLREAGESVMVELPGLNNEPAASGCQRRLVFRGGDWRIENCE